MTISRRARQFHPLAALVIAGFAFAAPARAGDAQGEIRGLDNSIALEFGITDFDYRETVNGATFDTEQGVLPTANLGIGLLASDRAQGALRNLYVRFDLTGSFGSLGYSGARCSIALGCVPATTTTDEAIYGSALRVGRGFPIGQQSMAIPFAEIDYRYWRRDITGAGGLVEDYHNWAALIGALVQYSPAHRWVLSASSAAGSTIGAQMNASALGAGSFDLASAIVWRNQAGLAYQLTKRLEWTASLGYDRFSYGASSTHVTASGACAGGCFEPDSTTQQINVTTGIAYRY